jgi:hypothetical protein
VFGPALLAVVVHLVSVGSGEVQANGHSIGGDISRNGRLVVFDSLATNLSRRARRGHAQHVYLRDRRRGTTRMVSLGSRGQTSNLSDWQPSISPNGRFVAWCSTSTNLARPDRHSGVPWTGPGLDPRTDVFVRDLRRGLTRRASDDRAGGMANNASCRPDVANDGDVAFESHASDLVPRDTNNAQLSSVDRDDLGDVYVHYRLRRTTRLVSAGTSGCYVEPVLELSPHARHVLFECGNGLFVRDLRRGRSRLANLGLGRRPPADSVSRDGLSDDGRTVVLRTSPVTMVPTTTCWCMTCGWARPES